MLDTNLILIGPIAAGKTTVAALLGEALGVPAVELDELRWGYYAEIGYDEEAVRQIHANGGMEAVIAYWKPFEVYSVERVLQDYPAGHVISFGAGQSVYDDAGYFDQVRQALAPCPYVILLLPSADVNETVRILGERFRAQVTDFDDAGYAMIDEMNRYFIEHPSNGRLATLTVYTDGKSAAKVCAEIIKRFELS